MKNLTVERVRELLDYNTKTGELRYKVSEGGRVKEGDRAGSNQTRYRRITIDSVVYREHHVIWLHQKGEHIPEGMEMDHINRDGLDNRIENLRVVTSGQNKRFRGPLRSNKTSGVPGVCFSTKQGKWVAYIMVNKKNKHLGSFCTKEEAVEARKKAEHDLEYFTK